MEHSYKLARDSFVKGLLNETFEWSHEDAAVAFEPGDVIIFREWLHATEWYSGRRLACVVLGLGKGASSVIVRAIGYQGAA